MIIIGKNWSVEGVLTDVTTAKLSDPTGTYGIRRLTPTQSDVVADGTAMTKAATGLYIYEYDDSSDPAGSTYTAYIEIVYGGATYHLERDFNKPADATYGTTYTLLRVAVADFLGWGRNSEGAGSDWTTDVENRLDDILNSGYRQFLAPPILPGENTAHRWSFLRPTATFDTAASDYLYDMPSDFGAIIGDILYDEDEDISRVIRHTSPGQIDRKRAIDDAEGRPDWFALRPKSAAQTAEQTMECMLYPTPDAAYGLIYHYDARAQGLSSTNLYPLGGQDHAETLLQSCRDIAAQRYQDDPAGPEHDLFMQRLQASVEYDRRQSPQFLGFNNDGRRNIVTRHGTEFSVSLSHNLGGGP
jgi:hypothetical protein